MFLLILFVYIFSHIFKLTLTFIELIEIFIVCLISTFSEPSFKMLNKKRLYIKQGEVLKIKKWRSSWRGCLSVMKINDQNLEIC